MEQQVFRSELPSSQLAVFKKKKKWLVLCSYECCCLMGIISPTTVLQIVLKANLVTCNSPYVFWVLINFFKRFDEEKQEFEKREYTSQWFTWLNLMGNSDKKNLAVMLFDQIEGCKSNLSVT